MLVITVAKPVDFETISLTQIAATVTTYDLVRYAFKSDHLIIPAMSTSVPARLLTFTLLCTSIPTATAIQDEVEFHDRPVAIIFHHLDDEDELRYFRTLTEKLKLQGSQRVISVHENADSSVTPILQRNNGTLYALQKGMIPAVESIDFSELASEEEFEKLIRLEAESGEKVIRTNGIVSLGVSPDDLFPIFFYLRYHDGLVYRAMTEQALRLSLPNREALLQTMGQDAIASTAVYLERIPLEMKTLGWNLLFANLSTQMQQRDGESDVDYKFRSSGGNLTLAIARAVMFDSDYVSGSFQLAKAGQPVRGKLVIDARKGSDLSNRLSDLSSTESRFAPILNDAAAVTLHLSTKLPEESLEVFRTGGEFLKDKLIAEAGADVDMVISGAEIAETLRQIADQNNLEMFLKLGWTEDSGGVIYGGMRVGNNPELLRSVLTLLTPESTPADVVDRFAIVRKEDRQFLEFLIPPDSFDQDSAVRLSHMYIAHANSCLWICFGRENSYRILEQSIRQCEESGVKTSTRFFTANLHLQRWLDYPDEDSTGLTSLPTLFDAMIHETLETNRTFEQSLIVKDDRVSNLLQKVLDLGGGTECSVHLDSSADGLSLTLEIGLAMGNYLMARWTQIETALLQTYIDGKFSIVKFVWTIWLRSP